jgi:hypothetical protein
VPQFWQLQVDFAKNLASVISNRSCSRLIKIMDYGGVMQHLNAAKSALQMWTLPD